MYPDEATCKKRLHLIDLQLEGLKQSQGQLNGYIIDLEYKKETIFRILKQYSRVGEKPEVSNDE